MKNVNLFTLLMILLLTTSCETYENPPFVVKTIGIEYFNFNDKCAYVSYEDNVVMDDFGKYKIGDTIPNVINYKIN